jgi:hypothetical protein
VGLEGCWQSGAPAGDYILPAIPATATEQFATQSRICQKTMSAPEPKHFAAGGASASSFRASDNLRTRSDNLTGKIGKVENILPIPRSGRSFRFVAADAEFIYNELCPEWMLPALAGSFADSSPERISERFVCAENVRGRFNRSYCASKSWKIAR